MTAIGVDFEAGGFAPPRMSEEEAVETLLTGARSGFYALPAGVVNAAAGASALREAARAVNLALVERFGLGWPGALTSRLASRLRDEATRSGAIPKGDPGAEFGRQRAEEAAMRDDVRVLDEAARGAETYPVFFARHEAATIATNLDAALGELLTAARPHSARIAALGDGADNLRAHRADATGFDALDALVPRLAALAAAQAALARLGASWTALPAPDGTPAVIRLARLAAEPAGEKEGVS